MLDGLREVRLKPDAATASGLQIDWTSSVNFVKTQETLFTNPPRSHFRADSASVLPERLLTVEDLTHYLSAGRTKVYELLRTKQLRSIKVGRRRLVRPQDLQRFLNDLIEA